MKRFAVERERSCATICLVLLLAATGWGQQGAEGLAAGPLRIVVLEGARGINSVPDQTSATPLVAVWDRRNQLLEGASVTFDLPKDGKAGVFLNGTTTSSTVTGSDGRASAETLEPARPGKFDIRVSAAMGGARGSVRIRQESRGSVAG